MDLAREALALGEDALRPLGRGKVGLRAVEHLDGVGPPVHLVGEDVDQQAHPERQGQRDRRGDEDRHQRTGALRQGGEAHHAEPEHHRHRGPHCRAPGEQRPGLREQREGDEVEVAAGVEADEQHEQGPRHGEVDRAQPAVLALQGAGPPHGIRDADPDHAGRAGQAGTAVVHRRQVERDREEHPEDDVPEHQLSAPDEVAVVRGRGWCRAHRCQTDPRLNQVNVRVHRTRPAASQSASTRATIGCSQDPATSCVCMAAG